uniref:N/A n=1 Tax=Ganoderma boninense TaxID=34458 RepID=A0A5K1K1U4_9APHY|nr:N/A [Ganoderma boninense]
MNVQANAQLDNLRSSYSQLETRVRISLRTQVGDAGRLGEVRSQALALGTAADDHIFPPGEYSILRDNLAQIVQELDQACTQSVDPPDAAPLPIIQTIRTGRRGRPPKQIQRDFLEFALEMRGPKRIAELLGCSSRTVRREALRLGLAEPGPPVFSATTAADGTPIQQHSTVTPPVSDLSDEQLDQAIAAILTTFPHFGRQMIAGNLRASGHRVPDKRIRASYLRVRGAPAVFGQRIIVRKKYQVPGPNSLVHHDGQHGLIQWKFVIHCFVDGYSRFVTGIRAHTNNRAATVLTLFLDAIVRHGCPSRVRGDHGTENLRVAEWMEEQKGLGRGSYIWGRVHNTRIERLWYDVTRGFGLKWKTFFLDLERFCGLDVDQPGHIWLLHHLFLQAINEDALEWAETWNAHRLHIKGEQSASPRELFMFGMIRHGPQGIEQLVEPVDERVDDVSGYGIDWDVIDDPVLIAHHNQYNPGPTTDGVNNPFIPVSTPDTLSQVTCDPPLCPLSPEKVAMLNAHLAYHFNLQTQDMLVRRQIWNVALDYCSRL